MHEGVLQIRLFDAADAVAVAAFGPAHGEPVDGTNWRRTLVAQIDETVVGAGTLRQNAMYRDVCSLDIDAAESAGGLSAVGRPLYEKLLRLRPQPWPVIWRVQASQSERLEFARDAGFEVLVRCPVPRVDPTSTEVQRWIAERADVPDVEVRTAASCTTDDLLDAWVTYYAWVHAGWIPITSIDTVRETLAGGLLGAVDRSRTAIAVRSGRIVAFALVFPHMGIGGTSLVGAETVHRDELDGQALVGAVIANSLRWLGESGLTAVDFDGHAIDPHYGPLAQTLPIIGAHPLTILRGG